jgi:hypothetical protein
MPLNLMSSTVASANDLRNALDTGVQFSRITTGWWQTSRWQTDWHIPVVPVAVMDSEERCPVVGDPL